MAIRDVSGLPDNEVGAVAERNGNQESPLGRKSKSPKKG